MIKLSADGKNKGIASRKGYATALTLILWATLQEIVMESTDLVDNFFANAITTKVDGFSAFITGLHHVFNGVSGNQELMNSWGLANHMNYNYTAGQLAMNGVTASNQVYFIMYAVVSGTCYGMGIYNAQYFGAGRYNELRQVTMLKIYVTMLITIVVLIFGQIFTEDFMRFTTSPRYAPEPGNPLVEQLTSSSSKEDAQKGFAYFEYRASLLSSHEGAKYFRIVSASYPILAINTSFITTMRETNRPLKALGLSAIALITNCICNPFLIEPAFLGSFHGIGVEGSAAATTASRIFQLCFLIGLFAIKKYEFIPYHIFKFNRYVVKKAFIKAGPIIFNELLWSLGMVVQVKLRAERGVDALTANAIFSTITSAIIRRFNHGFSAGTSILVGNRLGANKLGELILMLDRFLF